MRGFFGVGICGGKTPENLGTLWRSAYNLGADFIFTVGKRYPKQRSDTVKAWKHVPLLEFTAFDELVLPRDCVLVAVEQQADADELPAFRHPERAAYLLGAEDGGIPERILARCHRAVEIPTERCMNVAVAGSIVMYDRVAKAGA